MWYGSLFARHRLISIRTRGRWKRRQRFLYPTQGPSPHLTKFVPVYEKNAAEKCKRLIIEWRIHYWPYDLTISLPLIILPPFLSLLLFLGLIIHVSKSSPIYSTHFIDRYPALSLLFRWCPLLRTRAMLVLSRYELIVQAMHFFSSLFFGLSLSLFLSHLVFPLLPFQASLDKTRRNRIQKTPSSTAFFFPRFLSEFVNGN